MHHRDQAELGRLLRRSAAASRRRRTRRANWLAYGGGVLFCSLLLVCGRVFMPDAIAAALTNRFGIADREWWTGSWDAVLLYALALVPLGLLPAFGFCTQLTDERVVPSLGFAVVFVVKLSLTALVMLMVAASAHWHGGLPMHWLLWIVQFVFAFIVVGGLDVGYLMLLVSREARRR